MQAATFTALKQPATKIKFCASAATARAMEIETLSAVVTRLALNLDSNVCFRLAPFADRLHAAIEPAFAVIAQRNKALPETSAAET